MKQAALERVRATLKSTSNQRNIAVIAHVDHGKSTLTDSLLARSGIISEQRAGNHRWMDIRPDEQDRGITIKSTSVSLAFEAQPPRARHLPRKGEWSAKSGHAAAPQQQQQQQQQSKAPPAKEDFVINIIDCPGHVDFSSEVTAALRLADGALVVVDCLNSVCVQTETVLRQALAERVKPVLFVNKLDRIFLELQLGNEETYQRLARVVESVNVVIAQNCSEGSSSGFGDVTVWPQAGTVGFGSGLHGWGFTLAQFADMFHQRFNLSKKKMMKKLWGDNFYDPKTKAWSTSPRSLDGKRKLKRGFCWLVLAPMRQFFRAALANDAQAYTTILNARGVALPANLQDLHGKALLKRLMQAWLPAADALVELMVQHLPSPAQAQHYRAEVLYDGPQDDEAAQAIRACDPDGELMMYVSKMVPTRDHKRFYAFGRVYSGTLRAGQQVRIQGPDHIPGQKAPTVKLQGCVLMMGPRVAHCDTFYPGNMVGLVGVDAHLVKAGTVTTFDNACNFRSMVMSVSNIVRVAVSVKNPKHLGKLTTALQRLNKADPLLQVLKGDEGELILAGCGELHLQVCIKDLSSDFLNGVELVVSEPVVSFSESVTCTSSMECMAKSSNKHNRLIMTAQPIGEAWCDAVDDGSLQPGQEYRKAGDTKRAFVRRMVEDFEWHSADAKRVWSFGDETNALVDCSRAVANLQDSKDSIIGAFEKAEGYGVLCGEPLRGVRFSLQDAKLHNDSMHRSGRELAPATKQVMAAAQLSASPCLLEPMFLCTVSVPAQHASGVYSCLRARRAQVLEEGPVANSGMREVRAHLPAQEAFGLNGSIRGATGGSGFANLSFSHWAQVPGDPLTAGTLAHATVMKVRERKNMRLELPSLSDFHDRL